MSVTWNIETDSPLIMMLAMVEASKVLRMLRSKFSCKGEKVDQPEEVDEHEEEGEDAKAGALALVSVTCNTFLIHEKIHFFLIDNHLHLLQC